MHVVEQHKGALFDLIHAFTQLPGIGEKTAQRLAFSLLQSNRKEARMLANKLQHALDNVRHCTSCNTLCEDEICTICRNPDRNEQQLCIVEMPADQWAMEQSNIYRGKYFVLMGKLSILTSETSFEDNLKRLFSRCENTELKEIIIACNFTAEGEATAHVIATHLKRFNLKVTRLARGIPAGSELEYVDLSTIAYAYVDRHTP